MWAIRIYKIPVSNPSTNKETNFTLSSKARLRKPALPPSCGAVWSDVFDRPWWLQRTTFAHVAVEVRKHDQWFQDGYRSFKSIRHILTIAQDRQATGLCGETYFGRIRVGKLFWELWSNFGSASVGCLIRFPWPKWFGLVLFTATWPMASL